MGSSKKKMSSQKSARVTDARIKSFTPPTLHTGKEWYIGFHAYDPERGTMRRKKIKVNFIQSVTARRRYASQLISRLLTELENGWSPWVADGEKKGYTAFEEAVGKWLILQEKLFRDGMLRQDTIEDYRSRVRILLEFNKQQKATYIRMMTTAYCEAFLNYVYLDRGVSALTRNNYLNWLKTLSKWLHSQGYIASHVAEPIAPLGRKGKKEAARACLTEEDMKQLREVLQGKDRHFLFACYVSYYCFIRPKELSMLRVRDINSKQKTIIVRGEVSKSHKTQAVTITKKVQEFIDELKILSYPQDYYIFSRGFAPGEHFSSSRYFRENWVKIRRRMGWPENYKFYGLKNTGITNMLRTNDTLTVRDQARHSSISITDIYTPHDSIAANPKLTKYEAEF